MARCKVCGWARDVSKCLTRARTKEEKKKKRNDTAWVRSSQTAQQNLTSGEMARSVKD